MAESCLPRIFPVPGAWLTGSELAVLAPSYWVADPEGFGKEKFGKGFFDFSCLR